MKDILLKAKNLGGYLIVGTVTIIVIYAVLIGLQYVSKLL